MLVLSHYQAHTLLEARQERHSHTEASGDLNLTTMSVTLSEAGVIFPPDRLLTWPQLDDIAREPNKCFRWENGHLREIRVFSEVTNWARSLYPTDHAPTMLVAGLPMHRIKGVDPYRDTHLKIKAARPTGKVLDTATGLGYTAIETARRPEVQSVTTVELDPASLEIARENPWSQPLFELPNITQIVGHVWDVAEDFEDGRFTAIIHDPPSYQLAGELYSRDFYVEMYRILKARGRMFHYIGDPDSRAQRSTWRGVVDRLHKAGFRKVERKPKAYGVLAYK